MLSLFSAENREKLYLATLLAVGLMRFINLGFLDLQAWDEALYAVRSEGILLFGGWLDQTQYSIGGLYSALHPPVYVWLTTLSFNLFGVTEFAVRFFSALFGASTLFVIYRIGKELQSKETGFLAALLYGLNPFVTFLARQGQFDTTLVFFISLSAYYFLKLESEHKVSYSLFAGAAVGAALMTKLFVGLGIPLAFVLWQALRPEPRLSGARLFGFSIVSMLLVALPWHAFLTTTRVFGNPLFFLDASGIVERSLYGIEGNVKSLEWFYFVNQLLVLFPLGILWFIPGIFQSFRRRDDRWLFVALWFTVFFVVFSLMKTKLSAYALPMLVPASLIGARVIEQARAGQLSRTPTTLLICGTGLAFLWSSSQTWRNQTKALFGGLLQAQFPPLSAILTFLPFITLAVLVVVLTYIIHRDDLLQPIRRSLPLLVVIPAFLMSFYDIIGDDQHQYRDGARELAQVVADRKPAAIVVVGFDRNPQLTFYLDGADIGWREDISVRRLIPPPSRTQLRTWLSDQISNLSDGTLVIVEKDKIIRYEWITTEEATPVDYAPVFDSRRYAVFQRTPSTHLAVLSP